MILADSNNLKSTYIIFVPVSDGQIGLDVLEGENATISIKPDAGWELQTLYVDGNDCTYFMNGNRYTFENVTSNHTVSAVFQYETTDIQKVNTINKKATLKICDGRISLKGIDINTPVYIYSMDGKIIKKTPCSRLPEVRLHNGIYIIKANENTFKINI